MVAELREAAAKSEAPVREFTESARRRLPRRPSWSSTGTAGSRPTWRRPASSSIPWSPASSPRARRRRVPPGPSARRSAAPRSVRCCRSCPARCSASSTRSSRATVPAGRLLLVAPNIVQAERQLDVDPHDFRLWVCLHEETHRVQFTAVPWLRDHMRSLIGEFVDATELDAAAREPLRLRRRRRDRAHRPRRVAGVSLIELFQNEQQRAVVDKLTGIMSLLEGHADVVMDGVGPEVIPTRRRDPPQVRPAPQGRRRLRPDAPAAARPRGQDAPVPRRRGVRAGGQRAGRARRLQRGLGRAREPAHRRPRSPIRPAGSPASTADGMGGALDPVVAEGRRAVCGSRSTT